MIDTSERIKLIVSDKVYNQSYNGVNFFIHRVGKEWKSTEITTGRSVISMRKTKKQSITDTQRFIDHIKDVDGLLNKIVNDQINDRVLSCDDLVAEKYTRFNGI